MTLKVLLPYQVFATETDVTRIVAESTNGSFGLLPHRRDCVTALVPGILTYQKESGGEIDVAVDEGLLVKTGPDVLVSVRNAMGGTDLGKLKDAIEQKFLAIGDQEKSVRSIMAKLESGLLLRLANLDQ